MSSKKKKFSKKKFSTMILIFFLSLSLASSSSPSSSRSRIILKPDSGPNHPYYVRIGETKRAKTCTHSMLATLGGEGEGSIKLFCSCCNLHFWSHWGKKGPQTFNFFLVIFFSTTKVESTPAKKNRNFCISSLPPPSF